MVAGPLDVLKKYWGHNHFIGSQEKVIRAVLNKDDVMAMMPTAGGKSVCYQVPAMAEEGICIVVSPLVALIQDQVDQLKQKGIKALALTGGLKTDELVKLLDNCVYGNYKFLYLSPERLQQQIVQERIPHMDVRLIAIDEAHCISQWGHDFRPAYLECAILRQLAPDASLIALTATATEQVAKDILSNLEFRNTQIFKDSFLRKSISYEVIVEENKITRLRELCTQSNKSGIVYVRSRGKTAELAQYLNNKGISAEYYHGGLPKDDKTKKLRSWLDNRTRIMVATNAFGMGVDKPGVDLVVHYQIPDCLENFYQEAGRGGRDGSDARAVLITNANDEQNARNQFLDSFPDATFMKLLYRKLNTYFQVAYGEGKDQVYKFNFNEFCDLYQFKMNLAFNGLRILDQYSVLSLSQSFSRRSQLKIMVGKQQLMDYLSKNQNMLSVVQNILRTYGGVFDFNTAINTSLLARKTGLEESEVVGLLGILNKDQIVEYEAGHNDLEITFLIPREDDLTINRFASQLKELRNHKAEKLEAMLRYISNRTLCRNISLLKYFGEEIQQDCGRCDVCRARKKKPPMQEESIEKGILGLLEKSNKTSRQLISSLPYEEFEVLKMLQCLLEENQIRINNKNEYQRSP